MTALADLELPSFDYLDPELRGARFHDAMGSAKETMAALDVSVAAEYLPPESVVDDLERIDHIVATLWKMSGPRR